MKWFGYAKGAFTGAYAKRIGRIEMAQKGTLFLDEIGELSLDMQSKLLQVMEESSFERVGDARSINVDIRVLSATNIDLETSLAQGRLRRDLFYRLASGHATPSSTARSAKRYTHTGGLLH